MIYYLIKLMSGLSPHCLTLIDNLHQLVDLSQHILSIISTICKEINMKDLQTTSKKKSLFYKGNNSVSSVVKLVQALKRS